MNTRRSSGLVFYLDKEEDVEALNKLTRKNHAIKTAEQLILIFLPMIAGLLAILFLFK
jgi:hypothetical protein